MVYMLDFLFAANLGIAGWLVGEWEALFDLVLLEPVSVLVVL
jgi:hypothetical protein